MEKRALDYDLQLLKLKSQEPGSTAHLMPKQLQFSSKEPHSWPAEGGRQLHKTQALLLHARSILL